MEPTHPPIPLQCPLCVYDMMQWSTLDSFLLQGKVLVWLVCCALCGFKQGGLNKRLISLSVFFFFTGQVTENNRCSVSPASAFAIATAAAGHSSPPGRGRWWSQNHSVCLCAPSFFGLLVFVFHSLFLLCFFLASTTYEISASLCIFCFRSFLTSNALPFWPFVLYSFQQFREDLRQRVHH